MSDETVRLTYSELAKARGITLAAARRMTLRHKWPKQVGNDGLSHVLVPASALARPDNDGTGIRTDDPPGDAPGDLRRTAIANGTGVARGERTVNATAAVRSLSDAVASLGVQLVRERERADFAESCLQEAEDRAQAAEGRVQELKEQLATEQIRRAEDKERADRADRRAETAENRSQAAEDRVRQLTEQLTTEQRLRIEDKKRIDSAEQQANEAEDRAQAAEACMKKASGRARDLQDQLTAEMTEHRRIVGTLTEQLAARRSWWPWRR